MARSAVEAFDEYARPLEAALACVTPVHVGRGRVLVDVPKLFTMQQGAARLARTGNRRPMYCDIFQYLRIFHDPADRINGPYLVKVLSWTYRIRDNEGRDILLYHWDPSGVCPDPHLHVGSVLLDSAGHELGKSFSKLHIAIGHLPLQRVVRMLIEEFDVQPLNKDWDEILVVADAASV